MNMPRRLETFGFILAFTLLGVSGALVCAQDPFGAAEPLPPADAPMGEEKKEDEKKAGPPPTDDIVILSIRESNPTTPQQLLTAVKALLDYGAFDEARRYLNQLLDAKPTVGQLAAEQRRFGSAFFLRLATDKRVAPEGARVAEAVMQSAQRLHNDPARLRTLAKQAVAADAAQREDAVVELRNAGSSAVAPLLETLGNANLPDAQAYAREALVSLGAAAIDPLLPVLDSPNHELRAQAIAVLTRLRTSRVVVLLLRPAHDPNENPRVQAVAREALRRLNGRVPAKAEVEEYLYQRASNYFGGASPLPPDQDGLVALWRWNNEQGYSEPRFYPANLDAVQLPEVRGIDGVIKSIESVTAASIMAARVAADLYALFPNVDAYKRLFLATHLEAAKLQIGLGTPLPKGAGTTHAMASMAGVSAVEDVLSWSIKNDHFAAAIAAAEVLGDSGNPELLSSTSGSPRPLALALRHPDRRLRFAAAEAILKLESPTSFGGASFVPETLGYLAGSVGTRRALIAEPRIEVGRTFAGLLATAGYEVDVAPTGDVAMKFALEQPDYEIVFIADVVDYPDLNRVWQQLRKDPRTANVLVAFLYREENRLPLLEKAESDPLARAMPYLHTRPTLDFQLTQLFRKAGTTFVPYAERQRQAAASLDHLAHIATAADAPRYYDLQRQEAAVLRALATPGLTVHAAPVLGGLATHDAQLALVDVASNTSYDIIDRTAAARAFSAAVAKRGLLLTTAEIGAQYDRYNASEALDAATQEVLAGVLDTIEARTAKK